jgi:hypothetical protein
MIVTDGFYLPLCRAAAATWPAPDWPHWHLYQTADSHKRATKDPDRLTPACRRLLQEMAVLTCPDGTFPDLDLHGAGMHWLQEGGYLARHRDGEVHPLTGWYRRWNAILFVSECEGGELVVDGQEPLQPRVGRLVTFDSQIPHEVRPVTGGKRKSLSLFWWSLAGDGASTQATFTGSSQQPAPA